MNSTAFCNGCKRSFSSLQKLVRHCNKQKCGTNPSVEVNNNDDRTQVIQTPSQTTTQAVEQPVEQSAVQPIASNISSPMAGTSPMEKVVEPLACTVALTRIICVIVR